MYCAAVARALAQLMYRTALIARLFVWNIDTTEVGVVPPVDAFVGLSSIWIDASELVLIVTSPSSARKICGALINAMMGPRLGLPESLADIEVTTGSPNIEPPVRLMSGYSC